MDQDIYKQAELDRKERDRATGARSLLGGDICQECGGLDGMHGQGKEQLKEQPATADELIYILPGDHEAIYFPCTECNRGNVIPEGFTRLIVGWRRN